MVKYIPAIPVEAQGCLGLHYPKKVKVKKISPHPYPTPTQTPKQRNRTQRRRKKVNRCDGDCPAPRCCESRGGRWYGSLLKVGDTWTGNSGRSLASSPCSPIPRQVLLCKTGVGFEFEAFAAQCQILPGCLVKP